MKILIFHFFFIGIGAFFSLNVTGSFWITALLFLVFGIIPVFRLNDYHLHEMSIIFSTMIIGISIVIAFILQMK
ncbi:hypothetical protein CBG25_15465 [Arsenophonus sp. ENCA]|nr:hypothetical protein CBG25_15465 [Arsenophonus sp. ENCA]